MRSIRGVTADLFSLPAAGRADSAVVLRLLPMAAGWADSAVVLGLHGFVNRFTAYVSGTKAEDIISYGRTTEMLMRCMPENARRNLAAMSGFGLATGTEAGSDWVTDPLRAGHSCRWNRCSRRQGRARQARGSLPGYGQSRRFSSRPLLTPNMRNRFFRRYCSATSPERYSMCQAAFGCTRGAAAWLNSTHVSRP